MESVNVLCLGVSKVLYGILEASFSAQEPLLMMGNVDSLTMPLVSGGKQPNVIITESMDSRDFPDVLYRFPRAKVIGIEKHGKRISLWSLRPQSQELGELSSDELAAAIAGMNRAGVNGAAKKRL